MPVRHTLPARRLAAALGLLLLGACSMDTPVQQGPSSHLRFVQAIPNAQPIDIVVDSLRVLSSIGYRTASSFLRVEAGPRRLRMIQASVGGVTYVDTIIPVEFPRAYTLLSTGMVGGVVPIIAPDTAPIPLAGQAALRVIQAAPSGGTIDVYVTESTVDIAGVTPLLEDVPFRGNTEYLSIPVGRFRVRLTTANTKTVILDQTQFFGERAMRTIVATDAAGGGSPLVGLFLVDY